MHTLRTLECISSALTAARSEQSKVAGEASFLCSPARRESESNLLDGGLQKSLSHCPLRLRARVRSLSASGSPALARMV